MNAMKAGVVGRVLLILACVVLPLIGSGYAHAADPKALDADILDIANAWAHVKFEIGDVAQQRKQIASLAERASALMTKYPGHPEPVIWKGVLLKHPRLAEVPGQNRLLLTRHFLARKPLLIPQFAIAGVGCSHYAALVQVHRMHNILRCNA